MKLIVGAMSKEVAEKLLKEITEFSNIHLLKKYDFVIEEVNKKYSLMTTSEINERKNGFFTGWCNCWFYYNNIRR